MFSSLRRERKRNSSNLSIYLSNSSSSRHAMRQITILTGGNRSSYEHDAISDSIASDRVRFSLKWRHEARMMKKEKKNNSNWIRAVFFSLVIVDNDSNTAHSHKTVESTSIEWKEATKKKKNAMPNERKRCSLIFYYTLNHHRWFYVYVSVKHSLSGAFDFRLELLEY